MKYLLPIFTILLLFIGCQNNPAFEKDSPKQSDSQLFEPDCNFDIGEKYGCRIVSTKGGKWTAVDKGNNQLKTQVSAVVYDDSCMVKGHIKWSYKRDSIDEINAPVLAKTFFDSIHVVCGDTLRFVNISDVYISIYGSEKISPYQGIFSTHKCFQNLAFVSYSGWHDDHLAVEIIKSKKLTVETRARLLLSAIKKCKCK